MLLALTFMQKPLNPFNLFSNSSETMLAASLAAEAARRPDQVRLSPGKGIFLSFAGNAFYYTNEFVASE